MRVYILSADDLVTVRRGPIEPRENKIAVTSIEELHAARLSAKRLLALWNGLPGTERLTKIGDRTALTARLGTAMETLPVQQPARASKQNDCDAATARGRYGR
jgi:hypothetical protein